MTLNQLRTFLAVVDAGSVRAAAEALVVSQPAVSSSITTLERELGIDLIEPDGRGVRLTEAGASFAGSVRASLAQLDRGVRVAQSLDLPGEGAVRIASIATAAERLLLPLLADFRASYPAAAVTVQVGNRDAVWEALRTLDADLVVGGRPPASVDARVLGRASNTLVVVGLPPVPRERRGARTYLAASTWLLRESGSGTRDATDDLLEQLGLDPPRMVLGSNGAIEAAITAGFGVALLPLGAVAPALATGVLARIECGGTPVERPWHLVVSAREALSPTAALAARSLLGAHDGFVPTADGKRLLRG